MHTNNFNHNKYNRFAFAPNDFKRSWVDKQINHAPIWCSVDLRDGNQALIDPMTVTQKLRFFDTLVACGFKEIEIGFPSASDTEFEFTRKLIEGKRIPDDVEVQVLVQAREHLIAKTFEALIGVKKAIVHVYNSTSKVQREKAFKMSLADIRQIAVDGAQLVKDYAAKYPQTQWSFQYSPESFSQTEPDYAIEVVEAVCRVWQPETGQKVIINLPSTVEASTANIFADQIDYFCQNSPSRKDFIVSVHTHNDRGCAVACAELSVMAGADRVEGTLLGNGERTGNMDIITMAMNLYSQGIDPQLDFSDMATITNCVTECNNLPIHPRHPYVGELVFTAFSGSHQDAIKKCLDLPFDGSWDVAYLPIDPKDIGRTYQDVVRINSQSGKGGVAYVLQRDYGVDMPRWLQIDFSKVVQKYSDKVSKELAITEIYQLFQDAYLNHHSPIALQGFSYSKHDDKDNIDITLIDADKTIQKKGEASGTLSAFIDAMQKYSGKNIRVLNYNEHALTAGTRAEAIAYIHLDVDGAEYIGAAVNKDTVSAMLNATISGINQSFS